MVFDHEGKIYEDVKEMCAAYGIKPETFNSRIRSKHWNLEQALLTPVGPNYRDDPRITTKEDALLRDNRDYSYVTEHTGMTEDTAPVLHDIHKRVNPGPKYVWTDHKGNEYPSKKAMCHAYGISADLFKSRTWDGWPMCYALEKDPGNYTFEDHKGNTFKYLSVMCRAYNINKFEFQRRMDSGWTLEDALTMPSKAPHSKKYKSPCKRAF